METTPETTAPDGPDWDWIRTQLTDFIVTAEPKNASSSNFITSRCKPACGRAAAIVKCETLHPILDRLYPKWRNDNAPKDNFEFQQEWDAAQRLRARLESRDEVEAKLAGLDTSPSITAGGMHPVVWDAARSQWNLDNHAEAVDAVGRAVNSMLQKKLGRKNLSDKKLIQEAFSDKPPEEGKPRLRFTHIDNAETAESFRQGVMSFGAGCFAAIRNPLAHLPDDEIDLDEPEALEQLAAWSLLARWIDRAELVEHSGDSTGGGEGS